MLVRVVRLAPRAPAIARLGMLVRGLSSGPSTATTATKDKLLFTPGPLSTSPTVKAAMQRDLGSRDVEFIRLIKEVRSEVLRLANVSEKEFAMIPMQGSGTFGVEAVISSVIPRDKRLLLIANGAYGHRIGKMAKAHNIKHTVLSYPEDGAPVLSEIEAALKKEGDISHVAIVHSETTSGIINDIHSVGQLVAKYQKSFIVDAMSSFGALPIDFAKARIDYLVTSANKCLHGVPGFAIIIANRAALAATAGNARTLSLDVLEQLKGLDGDGQFRFTPPTHAMLACRQAIREIEAIGGVKGRFEAYRKSHAVIVEGLKRLGFVEYLPVPLQGPIISTWKYPTHPNWSFNKFYSLLNDRGFVIYPGKVTNADCFRIGHIGHITVQDSEQLVKHIAAVLDEMGIKLK